MTVSRAAPRLTRIGWGKRQHYVSSQPADAGMLAPPGRGVRSDTFKRHPEARPKYRSATRPRLQSLVWTTPVVHRGFAVRMNLSHLQEATAASVSYSEYGGDQDRHQNLRYARG